MLMSDPHPTDAFRCTKWPWGRALRCTRRAAPHLFSSRDVMLAEGDADWTAVAGSLGVTPDRLLLVNQVHGIHVAVARRGESTSWPRPRADIIVSDDPGGAIRVRVADCAPVLLPDPMKGAGGAAHPGWRGTASRAVRAARAAVAAAFRAHPP